MSRRTRNMKGYWHTPETTMSLGCRECPDLGVCGGQTIHAGGFNCLEHCCGNPTGCRSVCPNATAFTDRMREVGGWELDTATAARIKPPQSIPYVPMVFHNSARAGALQASAVAMPLYRFFDESGESKYTSRDGVSAGFKIRNDADLFLSGVAQDHEVEKWWMLGAAGRVKVIANLRRVGIAMATTPNFSLMVDRPRWDDLHSIKRIAQVYHEFVSEGLPAALHVNGRSARDFERWADYISAHSEVTHIAYEFTTGTGNLERMRQHTAWLTALSRSVGRRLGLIVRGGIQVIDELAHAFDVIVVDSSAFTKAHRRFVAYIDQQGHRRWNKRETPTGQPIDELLEENVSVSALWMQRLLPTLALAA